MNLFDIPFNMEFYFGADLKEIPISKSEMKNGIEFLTEQQKKLNANAVELGKLYGLIGVYLRIIGDLEESKKYLQLAIMTNERSDNRNNLFVNKLRLANTYQWERNFQKSNEIFKELIEIAENHEEYSVYLDFVYQHNGKNLFDQEEYELALTNFKKALEIRIQKGNHNLIESTELAIKICGELVMNEKEK